MASFRDLLENLLYKLLLGILKYTILTYTYDSHQVGWHSPLIQVNLPQVVETARTWREPLSQM